MNYHARIELPENPDVILVIMHDGDRYVSVPVHRECLLEGDIAAAVNQIISRAERDLGSGSRLYRGAPGERP